MREIHAYAKEISKSKEEEFKFHAAIHGAELEGQEELSDDPMRDIPEATKKKLEERMRRTAERMRNRGKK
jgi:hypothetical protein